MSSKFGESITTEYGALSYPEWDSKATYVQYQRVSKDGLVFAAKKTSIGEVPSEDSSYWELLASKPLEQGSARDTLVFEDTDKTQKINGKSINGSGAIHVSHGDASNTISVDTATSGRLGVVKAGTGISIDDEGTISANIPVADEHKYGSKDGISPFFITEDETTGSTIITGNNLIAGDGTTLKQNSDYTYSVNVPTGSKTTKGILQVGDNLNVSDGVVSAVSYSLPTASSTTLGGVKIGSGISISDGVISTQTYTLPTASATTLGGIKVGNNLSITDGVLSAAEYTLPTASADTLGGVKVGDGLSIADGVLSASGGSGSGWETVESSTDTTAAGYFTCNAYKNSNFILVNIYSKVDEKTISADNSFTFTIYTTTPFFKYSSWSTNSRCIIPLITNLYNKGYEYYPYDFQIGNTQTDKLALTCYVSKAITLYETTMFSFLIPYIEI